MTGLIVLILLLVLIYFGVPVGYSLGVAGAAGITLAGIQDPVEVAQQLYNGLVSVPLLAIPMFLLMANLMDAGGMSESLVKLAQSLIGGVRGSLAVGTVLGSMFMGGISGSSLADTTSVGSIMIPAMKSQDYPAPFAAAVTSAANMVGPIIPPSILMILYGFATHQSIFSLFFGGIVPGVLISLVYGVMAYIMARRNHYGPKKQTFSGQEFRRAFVHALPALGIPVLIVIGVLGGVFTVSESASIAAVYALVYLIIRMLFTRTFSVGVIWGAFRKTYSDASVVSFLIGGSALLGLSLSMLDFPQQVLQFVGGLHLDTWALLAILNLIMIFLGTFLEPAASILIIASVFLPLVSAAHVNLIQFGVLTVVNLQIGTLTPPVGTAAYITSRIADVPYESVVRNLLPWLGVSYALLALITYVPSITMWLPHMLHLL